MYTESEGIVLRQVKALAGRTMVLMFSQKYGKISVGTSMNEGKSKSKSALAIRPFTYGKYELFKNRDYYNLNGAETIRSFYSFGEDLDKFFAASYCLELTEKALIDEVPQPRLFSILLDLMKALEKRKTAFDTLTLAYMVKLLKEMGTMPALDGCALCGREDDLRAFSVRDGGVICLDCARKNTESNSPDKLIFTPEFDILKVIEYLAEKPIFAFEKVALKDRDAAELMTILKEYYAYHLDISKLKSESTISELK